MSHINFALKSCMTLLAFGVLANADDYRLVYQGTSCKENLECQGARRFTNAKNATEIVRRISGLGTLKEMITDCQNECTSLLSACRAVYVFQSSSGPRCNLLKTVGGVDDFKLTDSDDYSYEKIPSNTTSTPTTTVVTSETTTPTTSPTSTMSTTPFQRITDIIYTFDLVFEGTTCKTRDPPCQIPLRFATAKNLSASVHRIYDGVSHEETVSNCKAKCIELDNECIAIYVFQTKTGVHRCNLLNDVGPLNEWGQPEGKLTDLADYSYLMNKGTTPTWTPTTSPTTTTTATSTQTTTPTSTESTSTVTQSTVTNTTTTTTRNRPITLFFDYSITASKAQMVESLVRTSLHAVTGIEDFQDIKVVTFEPLQVRIVATSQDNADTVIAAANAASGIKITIDGEQIRASTIHPSVRDETSERVPVKSTPLADLTTESAPENTVPEVNFEDINNSSDSSSNITVISGIVAAVVLAILVVVIVVLAYKKNQRRPDPKLHYGLPSDHGSTAYLASLGGKSDPMYMVASDPNEFQPGYSMGLQNPNYLSPNHYESRLALKLSSQGRSPSPRPPMIGEKIQAHILPDSKNGSPTQGTSPVTSRLLLQKTDEGDYAVLGSKDVYPANRLLQLDTGDYVVMPENKQAPNAKAPSKTDAEWLSESPEQVSSTKNEATDDRVSRLDKRTTRSGYLQIEEAESKSNTGEKQAYLSIDGEFMPVNDGEAKDDCFEAVTKNYESDDDTQKIQIQQPEDQKSPRQQLLNSLLDQLTHIVDKENDEETQKAKAAEDLKKKRLTEYDPIC